MNIPIDADYENRRVSLQSLAMPLILAGVWTFFAFANPQFLSPRNLSMLMIELSVTATLAIGMLLIIVCGHIDLSAGSGVGLLGGIAAVLVFHTHLPSPAALGLALLVGIALWGLMGLAIVRLKIQAFIITLGGLLIFKGLFWLVIRSSTVPVMGGEQANLYSLLTTWYVPERASFSGLAVVAAVITWVTLKDRGIRKASGLPVDSTELVVLKTLVTIQTLLLAILICNLYRGLPLSFLILCAVGLTVDFVVRHTPFGRYLYAIGGNEEAALACGVPVSRTVITAFSIMGAVVALTGFMQTAYAGASTTTVGDLMELDAIAACVIGGASLKGGRGTVLGALMGGLIMASLLNGMTLLAVAPEIKLIIRGTVLVVAVLLDVRFRQGS